MKMSPRSFRYVKLATCLVVAGACWTSSLAWGQTVFNVASGDWSVAGNWHAGLPGAGGAVIGWNGPGVANANVTLNSAAGTVGFLQIGRLNTGVGVLNMNTGASLTLSGDLMLSAFEQDASATLVMAAGTTLSAGGITVVGKDGVGQTSTASFTMNGGAFTANNIFYLDRSSGATQATFTMTDGTATFNSDIYMHENAANGVFSVSGGTVSVNGTWYTTTAATVSLTGGEVRLNDYRSNHAIDNNGVFVNAGATVNPGDGATDTDTFNLYGSFQQTSGMLKIQMDSAAAGGYDVLAIQNGSAANTATLGGSLMVELLSGFTPLNTDTFTILTANSVIGTFANAPVSGNQYNLGGGLFTVTYNAGSVVLSGFEAAPLAVPEPSTVFLMLLGGAALWHSRRRK